MNIIIIKFVHRQLFERNPVLVELIPVDPVPIEPVPVPVDPVKILYCYNLFIVYDFYFDVLSANAPIS